MTHHDDDPFREVTIFGGLGNTGTAGGVPSGTLTWVDRVIEVLPTCNTPPETLSTTPEVTQSRLLPELTEDELDVVTADLPD